MAKILIVGCGAIGLELAGVLSAQGHDVTGLKRNPKASAPGRINYVTADISSSADLADLDTDFTQAFFIVSPDGRNEQSYRAVYETGLNNLLARLPETHWLMVSSTSVYGQSVGEWVDENSVAEPANITSRLIRRAEQTLMDLNPANIVVRFSGIYGPGREYLLRLAMQIPAIQQSPPYFTNRIHQQDCVGVLSFLLEQRLAGKALAQCYLASDDDPAPMWEVMTWLTDRLHCQPPTAKDGGHDCSRQSSAFPPSMEVRSVATGTTAWMQEVEQRMEQLPREPMRPTVKTVAADAGMNKRCSNTRLKALGYQFHYPSYKDGYLELTRSHALRGNAVQARCAE
ncbi:MAG: NAD-binding protein [Methylobacter sp.]|nr:NAD-binding protein [Methylobacter sp.]